MNSDAPRYVPTTPFVPLAPGDWQRLHRDWRNFAGIPVVMPLPGEYGIVYIQKERIGILFCHNSRKKRQKVCRFFIFSLTLQPNDAYCITRARQYYILKVMGVLYTWKRRVEDETDRKDRMKTRKRGIGTMTHGLSCRVAGRNGTGRRNRTKQIRDKI